jgi:hypothetical protein
MTAKSRLDKLQRAVDHRPAARKLSTAEVAARLPSMVDTRARRLGLKVDGLDFKEKAAALAATGDRLGFYVNWMLSLRRT